MSLDDQHSTKLAALVSSDLGVDDTVLDDRPALSVTLHVDESKPSSGFNGVRSTLDNNVDDHVNSAATDYSYSTLPKTVDSAVTDYGYSARTKLVDSAEVIVTAKEEHYEFKRDRLDGSVPSVGDDTYVVPPRSSYVIGHLPIAPMSFEAKRRSSPEVFVSRDEAAAARERLERDSYVSNIDVTTLSTDAKFTGYRTQVDNLYL